jgi:hypothetical protein
MRLTQPVFDLGALLMPQCTCAQTCQCIHHPFTLTEDQQLIHSVAVYGTKRWSLIAMNLPNRTPKQCRERWHYHLNPGLNKGPWTPEEDLILYEKHEELGNRWTEIAKFLPGRTDSLVKSRWNSTLRANQKESCAIAERKLALQPIWPMDFTTIPPFVHRREAEQG